MRDVTESMEIYDRLTEEGKRLALEYLRKQKEMKKEKGAA